MDNLKSYNATLILEDTISSKIWSEEITQLKEKFLKDYNFNSVQILNIAKADKLSIVDQNLQPIKIENNLIGNDLVFFVTDAVSNVWHNGQINTLVEQINNKCLVSVINILPKKMWQRTSLNVDSSIVTTIPKNIKNNLQIVAALPDYMEAEDMNVFLTLPTANIDKVNELLNIISKGGVIPTTSLYIGEASTLEFGREESMSVAQRQEMAYRMSSTQDSYSLAVFFSNVKSFTLSDINFVKDHMLPGTDKSIIAEMMLGGITEKALPLTDDRIEFEQNSTFGKGTENEMSLKMTYSGPKTIPTNPQEVEPRYTMKEGVGEILIKSLRYSEENAVKLLLKEKSNQDNRMQYDKEVEVEVKNKFKM